MIIQVNSSNYANPKKTTIYGRLTIHVANLEHKRNFKTTYTAKCSKDEIELVIDSYHINKKDIIKKYFKVGL